MPTEYAINGVSIRKVEGGYVLIIRGNIGRQTVLLIRNDGAMMDISGAAVDAGDRTAARMCLPHVDGGAQLVGRLHQGVFSDADAVRIRRVVRHLRPLE